MNSKTTHLPDGLHGHTGMDQPVAAFPVVSADIPALRQENF